jgi:hypothetical protein
MTPPLHRVYSDYKNQPMGVNLELFYLSLEAAMNSKVIVIDGKTYHSVEEMSPEIRQKYEQAMRSLGDANKNQIPDAFETMNIFADKDKDGAPDVLENLAAGHHVVNSMKIVIDGKEFDGLENLRPEARARYEEAMGKLDANRNGIPDFVEGMMGTGNQNLINVSNTVVEAPRRTRPLPTSPIITPDTSNGWMLMLAGLFILLLCIAGAGAVWYFFLR